MESILTQQQGYVFLVIWWLVVVAAIWRFFRKRVTTAGFLVSDRRVGVILGAITCATSWVWAPAFFVSSQKAYEQGIPGLFWFTFPNAMALVVFSFLAVKMRQDFDQGYTLPEFMEKRFSTRMERLYTAAISVAQCYAVIVNLTGALLLLNLVTGIPRESLIWWLGAMMVSLSLLRGIRSSLVADSIKFVLVTAVFVFIVPGILNATGGISSVLGGLGGSTGTFTNLFDPMTAWTFGVPISISLLSGIVMDQQQWQRAFSMQKAVVRKAFLGGGLIFTIVPIALGVLGFVAANPSSQVQVTQTQLAGFAVVTQFLPGIAVMAFTTMVLAGLVAAGSSALNAISSIGAIDIFRRIRPQASDSSMVLASRVSMLTLIAMSMLIASIPNIQILYLVLVVGAFRAALFVPTIMGLFSRRLKESYAFWGIILGIAVGVPLFVYGSVVQNATISSFGSLIPVVLTLIVCIAGRRSTSL